MLDKLNKIKWSQLSTLTINTHNKLSCNNSKFENLYKEIVKLNLLIFFFFLVGNSIYLSSFFTKIFLMTLLNKISGAATIVI